LVDLDDIVLGEVDRARHTRGVRFDVHDVSGAAVVGDAVELRRVVRNLIDNAARHATTTVSVGLVEHASTVELAVSDDGSGIDPDHADVVFERFTRLDEARSRDAGGTGLGLAIVREIVLRHGGSITIDIDHAPGAKLLVTFPAGDEQRGPTDGSG
jgi:signal transduction histidine kinase